MDHNYERLLQESISDGYGFFVIVDLGHTNPVIEDLVMTRTCKSGENIQPSPIEDATVSECDLMKQQFSTQMLLLMLVC